MMCMKVWKVPAVVVAGTSRGGSGGVTARGSGRPDYVNFFTILSSVRRHAMTIVSSQSQRNLKLQSTAEAR